MKDGRYTVDFGTTFGMGQAQLVLRNGAFTGSTGSGIPLQGWCRVDPGRNLLAYELAVLIPPNTDTLSGLSTGDDGRRVLVKGERGIGEAGNRFSFGLAGRAVDVAIRYIGPLED
jgi:hypothetical protein